MWLRRSKSTKKKLETLNFELQWINLAEAYPERPQTSEMELFATTFNGIQLSTIAAQAIDFEHASLLFTEYNQINNVAVHIVKTVLEYSKVCNFTSKKRLRHKCFPVNLAKFLRTDIL